MICLIQPIHESPTKVRVTTVHFKPERLTQEQRDAGIMLDITEADLPEREDRRGEHGVLFFNPKTEEFFVEYEPRPLTQEELLAEIIERLDQTNVLLSKPRIQK
jgi:hypothetical protein